MHLAASCYALATVAPAIEEVLGWDIFLATYLLSSVGGSVATFALGDAITVGASSGIFGVIGMQLYMLTCSPASMCRMYIAAISLALLAQ